MFTIDFLKNQGLPEKNHPFEAGLFTVIAVVSLLVFFLLCIQYFNNSTVLKSKQKTLTKYESMLQKESGEGSLRFNIEKNLSIYDKRHLEVADSIGRYVQWTPVLRKFVDLQQPSMLLNELSVIRSIEKKKITSIVDPNEKVDIDIINRTLKSDVYDFMPAAEDVAIEKYLADLRSSPSLKGVIKEAYIIESSDAEYTDSDDIAHKVKNHIINCLLNSQEIAGAQ